MVWYFLFYLFFNFTFIKAGKVQMLYIKNIQIHYSQHINSYGQRDS